MGAAWYRANGELRRRWRAMLLLVLLVGVAGGAVLATVAGARRSASAYERFREETLASDLDVAFADGRARRRHRRRRPTPSGRCREVAALGRNDYPFIVPAGQRLLPVPRLPRRGEPPTASQGARRRPAPRSSRDGCPTADDADEIAIIETYADESGLRVGDRAEFESFAPEQLEPLFTTGDAGPPPGPRFTLVVTGDPRRADVPERELRRLPAAGVPDARVRRGARRVTSPRTRVGSRCASTAATPMSTTVTETPAGDVPGRLALEITPAAEVDRKIDSSIDVIVTALALCALVAALAGRRRRRPGDGAAVRQPRARATDGSPRWG